MCLLHIEVDLLQIANIWECNLLMHKLYAFGCGFMLPTVHGKGDDHCCQQQNGTPRQCPDCWRIHKANGPSHESANGWLRRDS